MSTAERTTLRRLRQFCLALAATLAFGTAVELLILAHYEALPQRIPLVMSTLALISLGATWMRPTATVVRIHRVVMGTLIGGALLGMYEHLEHNAEFAREIQPNAVASTVLIEALTGANPLLAPGIYAAIGLLGMAGIWRLHEPNST